MNIHARLRTPFSRDFRNLPLTLTLETARGLSANFEQSTTTKELMELLDKRTDVNAAALDRFCEELKFTWQAQLTDVEMSERLLEKMGFFV